MLIRKQRILKSGLFTFVSVFMLILNACQSPPQSAVTLTESVLPLQDSATPESSATTPATATITITVSPSETSLPEPSPTVQQPFVVVKDQSFQEDTLTIEQVFSQGRGWLVIHIDDHGEPGSVVGYAPLDDGVNENLLVTVDERVITASLYAMLHIDAGVLGVYEFPGEDGPVILNGKIIAPVFKVTPVTQSQNGTDDSENIIIGDGYFSPDKITIKVGTRIKWENLGDYPHTVTADDGSFKSGRLQSGDKYEFSFDTVGSFLFYCSLHGAIGGQGMSGVIVVEP